MTRRDQKAHTKCIDSYVSSAANCHQLDVATASCHQFSSIRLSSFKAINQATLLALFVVEWIDAKIMDGGYGYPFFIGLTSSNGIAGGSGGGRCGEGGGVNHFAASS
jgi:hypothetical protein